jgi:hypothetical protein
VRVGRTGGHRKSAAGRGWMLRLDRPRVRVGFSAATIRKMARIGWDGKLGRGEGQSSKGQVQRKGRGLAPGSRPIQARHNTPRRDHFLLQPLRTKPSFSCGNLLDLHLMRLLLHGLRILGLSMSTSTATSGGGEGTRGEGWKDGRALKIGGW